VEVESLLMRPDVLFAPIRKQRLSDELVLRIRESIDAGQFHLGDRLPTIAEMARRFDVGLATVREALTKLEVMNVVEIRHGSGVYVSAGRPLDTREE
jgi:GntR family transcriptional regulator, transcriptional repressor for pyruvate dehydrogenase complex